MTINHSETRSFQQSSTVIRCRASGEGNERPPGFTSREEGVGQAPLPRFHHPSVLVICRPVLDRQGYPPKKDRALFWVPALPVSAPDG